MGQTQIDTLDFTLRHVTGLERLEAGGWPEFSMDLLGPILEEAGKLADEVIAPLNGPGDRQGSRLQGGCVRTPDGFGEAYRQLAAGGWMGLSAPVAHGGQGLPGTLAYAVHELWNAANPALGLVPLLTHGAVEAVAAHGTAGQKERYLEKMIRGQWTGAMSLTEPQAGSDVGALTTRAEPAPDGSYRIHGGKIFITWGEHDLTDNIVHLVLARLPGAPPGAGGISLFLVPKILPGADGAQAGRNDVVCRSLEHKLGIHASPTCVMGFGDGGGGAVGFLLGAENRGLACMFTMMNSARLHVGVQGMAIAERATAQAFAYARQRLQGRAEGPRQGAMSPIADHPDVRRMLLTMRTLTNAARGLCYDTALALDLARLGGDDGAAARADLLTPVAKAWSSDVGVEVASLGVQVHGGMGYVEETGAAQNLRDARIAPIYEGTNGIQAADLVMRKLPRGGGAAMRALLADCGSAARRCAANRDDRLISEALEDGTAALADATDWMLAALAEDRLRDALAGSAPYLQLAGMVVGGYYHARAVLASAAAQTQEAQAQFYAGHVLPQARALAAAATGGSGALYGGGAEIMLA